MVVAGRNVMAHAWAHRQLHNVMKDVHAAGRGNFIISILLEALQRCFQLLAGRCKLEGCHDCCSPCYCCEVEVHGFCVRTWPKLGAGSSRRCRNHSHTSHTLGPRRPREFQFANCAAVVTVCDNDAHAAILQASAWRFHVQTHKPAPPRHGALSGAPRAAACARVSACFCRG